MMKKGKYSFLYLPFRMTEMRDKTITIQRKAAPAYRFAAFLLLVLPHILIYGGVQIISAFGQEIMEDMRIGEEQLSMLSALGTLSKATAAFVGGFFAAKLGGKRTIQLGLAVMGLSGVLYLVWASSFGNMCLTRTVQGIGSGIANTCLVAMACSWFPRKERGLAQGAISGLAGSSIAISTVYAQLCVDAGLPWRLSIGWLLTDAAFGLCAILGVLYKDLKKTYGVNNVEELLAEKGNAILPAKGTAPADLPGDWRSLMKTRAFWLTICAAFSSGCFTLSNGFILPLFLLDCGFSAAEKTQIMSGGALSSLLLAVLSGIVSRVFFRARRCETVLIGYGSAGLLFLAFFFFGRQLAVQNAKLLFFFAFGMMYLGTGPFWTMSSEISAPAFSSRCVGVCLMLSGFGGFVMTNILGTVIERSGMQPAMCLFIACYAVVTLLILALMREERKRSAR